MAESLDIGVADVFVDSLVCISDDYYETIAETVWSHALLIR